MYGVTIYGFPVDFSYREIEKLLKRKCGINVFKISLISLKNTRNAKVKLLTKKDGYEIKEQLDGYRMGSGKLQVKCQWESLRNDRDSHKKDSQSVRYKEEKKRKRSPNSSRYSRTESRNLKSRSKSPKSDDMDISPRLKKLKNDVISLNYDTSTKTLTENKLFPTIRDLQNNDSKKKNHLSDYLQDVMYGRKDPTYVDSPSHSAPRYGHVHSGTSSSSGGSGSLQLRRDTKNPKVSSHVGSSSKKRPNDSSDEGPSPKKQLNPWSTPPYEIDWDPIPFENMKTIHEKNTFTTSAFQSLDTFDPEEKNRSETVAKLVSEVVNINFLSDDKLINQFYTLIRTKLNECINKNGLSAKEMEAAYTKKYSRSVQFRDLVVRSVRVKYMKEKKNYTKFNYARMLEELQLAYEFRENPDEDVSSNSTSINKNQTDNSEKITGQKSDNSKHDQKPQGLKSGLTDKGQQIYGQSKPNLNIPPPKVPKICVVTNPSNSPASLNPFKDATVTDFVQDQQIQGQNPEYTNFDYQSAGPNTGYGNFDPNIGPTPYDWRPQGPNIGLGPNGWPAPVHYNGPKTNRFPTIGPNNGPGCSGWPIQEPNSFPRMPSRWPTGQANNGIRPSNYDQQNQGPKSANPTHDQQNQGPNIGIKNYDQQDQGPKQKRKFPRKELYHRIRCAEKICLDLINHFKISGNYFSIFLKQYIKQKINELLGDYRSGLTTPEMYKVFRLTYTKHHDLELFDKIKQEFLSSNTQLTDDEKETFENEVDKLLYGKTIDDDIDDLNARTKFIVWPSTIRKLHMKDIGWIKTLTTHLCESLNGLKDIKDKLFVKYFEGYLQNRICDILETDVKHDLPGQLEVYRQVYSKRSDLELLHEIKEEYILEDAKVMRELNPDFPEFDRDEFLENVSKLEKIDCEPDNNNPKINIKQKKASKKIYVPKVDYLNRKMAAAKIVSEIIYVTNISALPIVTTLKMLILQEISSLIGHKLGQNTQNIYKEFRVRHPMENDDDLLEKIVQVYIKVNKRGVSFDADEFKSEIEILRRNKKDGKNTGENQILLISLPSTLNMNKVTKMISLQMINVAIFITDSFPNFIAHDIHKHLCSLRSELNSFNKNEFIYEFRKKFPRENDDNYLSEIKREYIKKNENNSDFFLDDFEALFEIAVNKQDVTYFRIEKQKLSVIQAAVSYISDQIIDYYFDEDFLKYFSLILKKRICEVSWGKEITHYLTLKDLYRAAYPASSDMDFVDKIKDIYVRAKKTDNNDIFTEQYIKATQKARDKHWLVANINPVLQITSTTLNDTTGSSENTTPLTNTTSTLENTSTSLDDTTSTLENTSDIFDNVVTIKTESNLADDSSALRIDSSTLNDTNSTLENTSTSLKKTNTALDNDRTTLNKTNSTLENTSTSLKKTNTALENTSTSLKKTNTALENTGTSLDKTTSPLENTSASLNNTNSTLENTSTSLNNTNSTLENNTTTLNNRTYIFDNVVTMKTESNVDGDGTSTINNCTLVNNVAIVKTKPNLDVSTACDNNSSTMQKHRTDLNNTSLTFESNTVTVEMEPTS